MYLHALIFLIGIGIGGNVCVLRSPLLSANDTLTPQAAIQRCDSKQPLEVRKQTLVELRNQESPEFQEVIPTLVKLLQDSNPKIRKEVISTLGRLLVRHHQPCPMELVQACFDSEEAIQDAMFELAFFPTLPEEAVPVLLDHAQSRNTSVRLNVMNFLRATAVRDEQVIRALKAGADDPDVLVRVNALVALSILTQDYEFVVPRWITIIEASPHTDDGSDETARRSLAAMAAATGMRNAGCQSPQEVGKVLVSLLGHDSKDDRGPAARHLGALARENAEILQILKQLKAEDAITALLQDPDRSVRREARHALKFFREEPKPAAESP